MKIAAFNVENLFDRAKAFNESNSAVTQRTLRAVAELNSIFEEENYTPARKNRILELVETLELNRFNEGPLALIRKIRGAIIRRYRLPVNYLGNLERGFNLSGHFLHIGHPVDRMKLTPGPVVV